MPPTFFESDVLLMTATIDLKQKNFHALQDPKTRLRQYIQALILWIRSRVFKRIVFCENSQSPYRLETLLDIAASNEPIGLEVLLIGGNEGSWLHGPSWGEARILENSFAHSSFLNESRTFWKTTGRLYVNNINALHQFHQRDANVFDYADTRFWKANTRWYRDSVLPSLKDSSDAHGRSFEVSQFMAVEPALKKGYATTFREKPQVLGQSGQRLQMYGAFPKWVIAEAERWLPKFEP